MPETPIQPLASLQVSEDLVRSIAEKTLVSLVAQSLGDPNRFISAIVAKAINTKCDTNGNISTSNYQNTEDFVQVVATKLIQDKAKQIIKEFLEQKADIIKDELTKELAKPANMKTIAKSMIDATANSFKSHWNFQCNISFKEKN